MWRRVCAERPKLAAAHAGGGGGGGAEDVFESALARVVRPASLRPCVPASLRPCLDRGHHWWGDPWLGSVRMMLLRAVHHTIVRACMLCPQASALAEHPAVQQRQLGGASMQQHRPSSRLEELVREAPVPVRCYSCTCMYSYVVCAGAALEIGQR
jgi:hypothetical protein